MNMPKKKQKGIASRFLKWFKKFWMIIFISAAIIVYGVVQLIDYFTVKPFNDTNTQVSNAYYAFQKSDIVIQNEGNLTKECHKSWAGFVSSIECGTYVTLSLATNYQDLIQKNVLTVLEQYGFRNISLGGVSKNNNEEGTGHFYARNGMICGLYWGRENSASSKPKLSFYCRDDAPHYLPGYTKE